MNHVPKTYPRVIRKSPDSNCNICLRSAPLTEDHVPPKTCLEALHVEIEPFEHRLRSDRPRLPISQNGMKFETLCGKCNSMLGTDYDHELGAVARGVRAWLCSPIALSDRWTVRVDASKVLKSIYGHLLAADANDPDTVQDREMREYLLGGSATPGDSVRCFYWIHDSPTVLVLRGVAMPAVRGYFKETGIFSLLKFPPLGFIVTTLDAYEGLPELDPSIPPSFGLRFWRALRREADWPERVDTGNFLMGGRSLQDARLARPRATRTSRHK